jgi:hypothetical protein
MSQLFSNNASTTLNGGITNSVTSLVVSSTTNFPTISNIGDYFYATITDNISNWEIVKVTATSGTTFTVVRGQDNTTALAWSNGVVVEIRPVAQGLRDISNYTATGTAANSSLLVSMAPATTATASTIAERDSSGNLTANEFIGSGAGLTSNTIPVGSLVTTGTPSATTFLNGVGAFVTPVSGFSRIAVADANYTITVTTATILAYSSITTTRTLTLPESTTSGQLVWVVDESGFLTSSINLNIVFNGTDTAEGQSSFSLIKPYSSICFESNGSGKWTIIGSRIIIPNNQIVYGNGSSLTSSSNLIFDGTTLASTNLSTNNGIDITPVIKPTSGSVALITVTGNLGVGTYYYGVAFQTALGVTGYYQIGSITTTSTQQQVTVTIPISSDSRVTGRVIYRTEVGGFYNTTYTLATITNNTSTSYVDNIADTSLTVLGGALQVNTTSKYLTINGNKVLTLDPQATYVGFNAGASTTVGSSQNVFVGYQAGYVNTSGSQNTYIGYEAGSDQTTGSNNTHIGAVAGGYISTGSNNCSLGTGTLNGLGPNSSGNIGIGYYTLGDGAASATCNYNTAIGYEAGDIYAANNGIFLGYFAGKYETTQNNTIIIDNLDRTTQVLQKSNALFYGVTNTASNAQTLQLGGGGITTINGQLNVNALFYNGISVNGGFACTFVTDANYTLNSVSSMIVAYTAITVSRTFTLPPANYPGQMIWVVDETGSLSSSKYITILPNGSDTIEGQTSFVLTGQYAAICLASNGSGKWIVLTYEELPIAVADANYTIPYREDCIVQMNSLTAGRTVTLPSCVTSGQRVTIMDFSGAASASKIITVAPAGADTINGSTSPYLINSAYGQIVLVGNGSGKWSYSVALSNINLGTSFTEYAYNTSTTTTSDSTSFGYGSGGAASQAFAPTGENSVNKSFQFLQPIQPTDLITLEFNISGYGWLPVEYTQVGFGFNPSSSTFFGAFLGITSSSGGYAGFCNTANPTTTWAVVIAGNPNIRWRVRKTSQGNFAQGSPSYSTTIGNASATSFTVTHNLGTPIYSVSAWETTGSLCQITADVVISNPTSTTVTLTFTSAPALNAVQVLVQSNGGTVANNDRLSNLANSEVIISAAATASTSQWNRCYATSAAYALTLPPVLASAGKIVGVRIDSSSTYNVTVTGNGTDSIDGNNTFFMVPREVAEFKSDGVSWQRLSSNSVDGNWTPVLTTFTLTGSPVITARYKKTGNLVWINIVIQCTSGNTFASVNNSSRLTCPFTQSIPSVANFLDNATNTSYGVGSISSSAVWFPAITATSTSQIIATGTYSLN